MFVKTIREIDFSSQGLERSPWKCVAFRLFATYAAESP